MAEIRDFRPEWAGHVDEILAAAFPGPEEATLVQALRASGEAVVELVALEDNIVVGHILLSRLVAKPPTIRLAGLAPVAVAPARQRAGIGGALIREGLARAKAVGFDAVAVLGDPAYYGRFGFHPDLAARALRSPYDGRAYQALELRARALEGGPWTVTYPAAFADVD